MDTPRSASEFEIFSPWRPERTELTVPEIVKSPVAGSVWKIEVSVGDTVEEGDEVIILESMKMEIPAESEGPGTVAAILCEEGQSVEEGQALLEIS
jgi:acetyl-CoA carboxylase biotin carboxyl carrier protein